MPVISFIQPKGGAGKSTAALVFATTLAAKVPVTIIDADERAPLYKWAQRGSAHPNIKCISHTDEKSLLDVIDDAARASKFVIVDTEGTANLGAAYAVGASDLVVIPSQGTPLDHDNAAEAIQLIKRQERQSRRSIPHVVLFTRTSATIETREMKAIRAQLEEAGVDVLECQLFQRAAFQAMFSYSATLNQLDPRDVPGTDKAITNAVHVTAALLSRLDKAGNPAKEEAA